MNDSHEYHSNENLEETYSYAIVDLAIGVTAMDK